MAFTTVPVAAARLRASVLSALITELRPLTAQKTGDTTYTSDIVRDPDADLTVAVPANTVWDIEAILYVSSAANAAGDFAFEFRYPTGATLSHTSCSLVDTVASGSSGDLQLAARVLDATSPTAAYGVMASTTMVGVMVKGRVTVGSTAGDVLIAAAQLASNASLTTLHGGSTLVLRRMS